MNIIGPVMDAYNLYTNDIKINNFEKHLEHYYNITHVHVYSYQ